LGNLLNDYSLDELKEIAKEIFLKALSAVNPSLRLEQVIRIEKETLVIRADENSGIFFDLREFQKIVVVGTGKAAASMAQAIEKIFQNRISRGIITTKYGHQLPLKYTETIEAGHPLPDQNGQRGAEKIGGLLNESGPHDLVIFLLSGGGSALLPWPAEGITLEEKQEVTQLLLNCGADIKEINTVRKHISE